MGFPTLPDQELLEHLDWCVLEHFLIYDADGAALVTNLTNVLAHWPLSRPTRKQ